MGLYCAPICAKASKFVLDQHLLGMGVDPRVDRLVTSRAEGVSPFVYGD